MGKTTEKILKGQKGEFITKTGEKLSYKDILENCYIGVVLNQE